MATHPTTAVAVAEAAAIELGSPQHIGTPIAGG